MRAPLSYESIHSIPAHVESQSADSVCTLHGQEYTGDYCLSGALIVAKVHYW